MDSKNLSHNRTLEFVSEKTVFGSIARIISRQHGANLIPMSCKSLQKVLPGGGVEELDERDLRN